MGMFPHERIRSTERQRKQYALRQALGSVTGAPLFIAPVIQIAGKYGSKETVLRVQEAHAEFCRACKELEADIRKEFDKLRRETMDARNTKDRARRASYKEK